MVTFGAVKEREFSLIEAGEYCLTLNELEESSGQFGDRMIWKFLVAPVSDPTNYINKRKDGTGDEKDVWVFTDPDIILGSIQHEFVEKLTERPFAKGSEPPDEDDLIGHRIIGYITHYVPKKGKNAGTKQEQVVAGSIKPFKGPSKTVARAVEPDPNAASSQNGDVERAELVEETRKQIRKATILDLEHAEAWAAIDLEGLTHQELRDGLQTIKEAIAAA
jgi:hypothetical protein